MGLGVRLHTSMHADHATHRVRPHRYEYTNLDHQLMGLGNRQVRVRCVSYYCRETQDHVIRKGIASWRTMIPAPPISAKHVYRFRFLGTRFVGLIRIQVCVRFRSVDFLD
jgi:hypothetical protein